VRPGAHDIVGAGRHLLQRALLGIALKEHYAPSTRQVLFSERIVAKIRQSLVTDSYEAFAGPFGAKWFGGASDGPNPRSYTGIGFYRVSTGALALVGLAGIDWFLELERSGASEHPEWALEAAALRFRAAWFDDWEDQEAAIPYYAGELSPDQSCPCGLGGSFGECCRNGWIA
jgi:hypothetical protein